VPELARALEQLSEEKFPKIMAYLRNPISQRVRTNNHVERTNRTHFPHIPGGISPNFHRCLGAGQVS
jgi:hypothetical protein